MHPAIILIFIAPICLGGVACYKPDVEQPDTAAESRAINDASWQTDSIRMCQLWKQYWYFDDNYRHDSAISVCHDMIKLGERLLSLNYDSSIYEKYAKAFAGVGYNLMEQGQLDEALKWSLAGYNKIRDKFGEDHIRNTEIYVGIAFNYVHRGDYKRGLEYLFKSLDIMNRIFESNHPYFGNDYENLGIVYELMGDIPNAQKWFEQALENFRHTKIHETGLIYTDLAHLFLGVQDYEKVIYYAQKALEVNERNRHEAITGFTGVISSGRAQDIVRPLTYLGIAYRETGRDKAAETCLLRAIKDGQSLFSDFVSECQIELGATYQKQGELTKALHIYEQAITLREQHSGINHPKIANILLRIAQLKAMQHDFDDALNRCQQALKNRIPDFSWTSTGDLPMVEKLPTHPIVLSILHQKSALYLKRYELYGNETDLERSQSTASLAAIMVQRMNRSYRSDISKQTLSSKALPVFETGITGSILRHQISGDLSDIQKAFEYAEQCKAISLLEKIRKTEIITFSGVPADLSQKENDLHREIAHLENLIYGSNTGNTQLDSIRLWNYHKKLTGLNNEYDLLINQLAKRFPEYFQLKFGNNAINIAKLQKTLSPGTALLEYFMGDSLLYVFCLTTTDLKCHKQPVDSAFLDLLSTFPDLFKQRESQKPYLKITPDKIFPLFAESASRLYDYLIRPVLPANARHLIIIPDGSLGHLPFQLLLENRPSTSVLATSDWRALPYLIKSKNIRYEYSAALLLEQNSRKTGAHPYAGFAPVFQGEPLALRGIDSVIIDRNWRGGLLPDLKYNRPEVKAITDMTGGRSFLEHSATEQTFKQQAPAYRILHLATHACTDDSDHLYSQILFTPTPGDTSEDGVLHVYEIYNMRLNAELAVLSACQTGAGKIQRGEGIMSLSRAFKYAGCPNIVMSLWNTEDASARNIMVSFFQNLKEGSGKTTALCAAQRNFLKNATQEEAYPGRWATFVLVGDDSPVAFYSGRWQVVLMALGLAFVILYLFFFSANRSS